MWSYLAFVSHELITFIRFTGHNAPLTLRDEENYYGHPGYKFSMYDTVQAYLNAGARLDKMVLGVASYGRGFQLVDNDVNGIYCPADDGFPMGPYTRQKGHFGYLEVLQLFNNITYIEFLSEVEGVGAEYWDMTVDDCYQAPYIVNGPYWLAYDDPTSIAIKTQYSNFLGAAGMMIWSLETDDFGKLNSPEKYPLLKTINRVLEEGSTFDPAQLVGCGSAPMCEIGEPIVSTTADPGDLDSTCNVDNEGQAQPYPGDCHLYYYCIPSGDGYITEIYDCGDYFFNPNTLSCGNENDPGDDRLCPET